MNRNFVCFIVLQTVCLTLQNEGAESVPEVPTVPSYFEVEFKIDMPLSTGVPYGKIFYNKAKNTGGQYYIDKDGNENVLLFNYEGVEGNNLLINTATNNCSKDDTLKIYKDLFAQGGTLGLVPGTKFVNDHPQGCGENTNHFQATNVKLWEALPGNDNVTVDSCWTKPGATNGCTSDQCDMAVPVYAKYDGYNPTGEHYIMEYFFYNYSVEPRLEDTFQIPEGIDCDLETSTES